MVDTAVIVFMCLVSFVSIELRYCHPSLNVLD